MEANRFLKPAILAASPKNKVERTTFNLPDVVHDKLDKFCEELGLSFREAIDEIVASLMTHDLSHDLSDVIQKKNFASRKRRTFAMSEKSIRDLNKKATEISMARDNLLTIGIILATYDHENYKKLLEDCRKLILPELERIHSEFLALENKVHAKLPYDHLFKDVLNALGVQFTQALGAIENDDNETAYI